MTIELGIFTPAELNDLKEGDTIFWPRERFERWAKIPSTMSDWLDDGYIILFREWVENDE